MRWVRGEQKRSGGGGRLYTVEMKMCEWEASGKKC